MNHQKHPMTNQEFIEKHYRTLSRQSLKMVSYHGKLLWTFLDENNSTRTLTQKEFSYYLKLCLQHHNEEGKKMRDRAAINPL